MKFKLLLTVITVAVFGSLMVFFAKDEHEQKVKCDIAIKFVNNQKPVSNAIMHDGDENAFLASECIGTGGGRTTTVLIH
jgi:hypothetical protein